MNWEYTLGKTFAIAGVFLTPLAAISESIFPHPFDNLVIAIVAGCGSVAAYLGIRGYEQIGKGQNDIKA